MSDPRRLKEAMRDPCDIAATHVRSDPVREAFRGDAEWDGVVKMFALQGCATASEAFPWSHETDSGGRRYVAVLGLPPVRSAVDAVRASMASDRRRQAGVLDAWKERARALKVETYALYLACRDPRTPWYARAFAACVVGYAFSPIDLIPDPIPGLGYLDDLVLVPLGVLIARRMIPPTVLADARERARETIAQGKPINWIAAAIIVAIWLATAGALVVWDPKLDARRSELRHYRGRS